MKKVLSLFILTAFLVTVVVSCEKEREAPEACFDTGNSELKAGKTIHFMNCSKNYDRTRWVVADSALVPLFISPSDTQKHFDYSFPVGRFNVILYLLQGDSASLTQQTTEYTFIP